MAEEKIIREGYEISVYYKNFTSKIGITDTIVSEILMQPEDEVKKIKSTRNAEIKKEFLYGIYFLSNEYWLKASKTALSDDKVEKIQCTRLLREACKKEIERRILQSF